MILLTFNGFISWVWRGAKCSISLPHICGFVLYIYCYFFITNIIISVGVVDLQLPVQSVPITTKVMNSNPVYDDVYLIQHYVIKFVSELPQVGGFLRILQFPPPIKLTAMI